MISPLSEQTKVDKSHPYKRLFQGMVYSQPNLTVNDNNLKMNQDNGNINSSTIDTFTNLDNSKESPGLGLSFENLETNNMLDKVSTQQDIPNNDGIINNNTMNTYVYPSNQETPIRTSRTIVSLDNNLPNNNNKEDISLFKIVPNKIRDPASFNCTGLSETGSSSSLHTTSAANVASKTNLNNVHEIHSNNMSTTSINLASLRKKSQSVDLSHLYLLNTNSEAQLTSTNESVADMSHQIIKKYLGEENDSSLVPRLKTIEMYKESVKKSKDPKMLFEFAQYLLQTALTTNTDPNTSPSLPEKIKEEQEIKKIFLKESKHYLKKLSVKGYADAQYLLADSYSSGVFGKVDNKEAFTLFQTAAKHGHIESAYRTAHCYEEGIGTTSDSRKALNFLKFAASRNHPSAMFKLGLYSFYGKMGLPTDVNTKQNGIKWLSRAAARATELTAAAPYELAKIYEVGFLDILIPDEKYAMELYIEAAALGHVPSSTLLGQIYETGNDTVPQDVSLSVHYYTQAALRGDPVAMLGLCAWYLLGAEPAFSKDENEAFQWAYKAAIAGYAKAQFTLGYFYEHGKGCSVDDTEAWKWYERAAKNDDERAINKLKKRKMEIPKKSSKYYKIRDKNHSRKTLSISTLNLFGTSDAEPKDKKCVLVNETKEESKKKFEPNFDRKQSNGCAGNEQSKDNGVNNVIHEETTVNSESSVFKVNEPINSNIDGKNNNILKKQTQSEGSFIDNTFIPPPKVQIGFADDYHTQTSVHSQQNSRNTVIQLNNEVNQPNHVPSDSKSSISNTFKFAASAETPKLLQKQAKSNQNKNIFSKKQKPDGFTQNDKKKSKKECIIM